MKRMIQVTIGAISTLVVSFVVGVDWAHAGPPLLCHPFAIGETASLAWGTGAWDNGPLKKDDDEAFVAHTLELLSPATSVLGRMETIRRATIHAAERPRSAKAILGALQDRVTRSETTGNAYAHALFDFGYLLATYVQMNIVTEYESRGYAGGRREGLPTFESFDAQDLIKKASDLLKSDAEMEFALALMASQPAQRAHLQKAVTGATEGSLLARNLVRHFGREGQTLADLRNNFGVTGDGERY